jgi:transcription initiation factor TFIIIB Brf1 subunit/transcription initiation factor TFIIB
MVKPTPTRCPKCGTVAAEWICHLCKTVKEPRWIDYAPKHYARPPWKRIMERIV